MRAKNRRSVTAAGWSAAIPGCFHPHFINSILLVFVVSPAFILYR